MSIRIMSQVWEVAPFEGATLLLLLALADRADDDGVCWPKVSTLMAKTRQPQRTVYAGLKTLQEAGWLKKWKEEGKVYFAVQIAAIANPDIAIAAKPSAAIAKKTATIAKPPHPHKGVTVIEPSVTPQARSAAAGKERFILPNLIDAAAWGAFVEMRQRLRKPMTDRARELVIAKLLRMQLAGQDVTAVLEQSVMNGWTDVYEVKDDRRNQGSNGHNKIANNLSTFQRFLDREETADRGGADRDGLLPAGDDDGRVPGVVLQPPRARASPARSAVGADPARGETRGSA